MLENRKNLDEIIRQTNHKSPHGRCLFSSFSYSKKNFHSSARDLRAIFKNNKFSEGKTVLFGKCVVLVTRNPEMFLSLMCCFVLEHNIRYNLCSD